MRRVLANVVAFLAQLPRRAWEVPFKLAGRHEKTEVLGDVSQSEDGRIAEELDIWTRRFAADLEMSDRVAATHLAVLTQAMKTAAENNRLTRSVKPYRISVEVMPPGTIAVFRVRLEVRYVRPSVMRIMLTQLVP